MATVLPANTVNTSEMKPARWNVRAAATEHPELWRGLQTLLPLWEGAGGLGASVSNVARPYETGITIGGTTAPTWTPVETGHAVKMTAGNNQRIEFTDKTYDRGLNEMTVLARVRVDTLPTSDQWIAGMGTIEGATRSCWFMWFDPTGASSGHTDTVTFLVNDFFGAGLSSKVEGPTGLVVAGKTITVVGRWLDTPQHVDLWADGVQVAIDTLNQAVHMASDTTYANALGLDLRSSAKDLSGSVEMYALWDRRLTDAEVSLVSADPYTLLRPARRVFTITDTISDDFNRANENLQDSSNWTAVEGTSLDIVSNQVVVTSAAGVRQAYRYETELPTNHYAQIDVTDLTNDGGSPSEVAVACRFSASAATYYMFQILTDTTNGDRWRLFRLVAGSDTLLDSGNPTFSIPDTIRLSAVNEGGDVRLRGYINGVEAVSYLDTNAAKLTTETHAGVVVYVVGSATGALDNFDTGSAAHTDDFEGSSLDSDWTEVDNVGDSTISVSGGQAKLSVPSGTSHDAWHPDNDSTYIRRDLDDIDQDIRVKIDSDVDYDASYYRGHGLLFLNSNGTFIRFDIYQSSLGPQIYAAYVTPSSHDQKLLATWPEDSGSYIPPYWFRVTRLGDSWQYFTSTNGTTWNSRVTFTQALTLNYLGLMSNNADGTSPAYEADFDWYERKRIALDNSTEYYNSASSSTISYSHTCTGTDLFLVVCIGGSPTSHLAGDVTYNGVNMTFLSGASGTGGGNSRTETWVLADPPTGSHTVSISLTPADTYRHSWAASFTGVDTYGAVGSNSGSSASGSVTVTTTADNSWVLGIPNHGRADINTTTTPGTDDVGLFAYPADQNAGYNLLGALYELREVSAASTTVSYTTTDSRSWFMGGVELKPTILTTSTVTHTVDAFIVSQPIKTHTVDAVLSVSTLRNYSNIAVSTTLASGINSTDLSLTVVSATGYPAVPFAIEVEDEVVLVGEKTGTTFSSLTRHADGTTAVAHLSGAAVEHTVIAADLTDAVDALHIGTDGEVSTLTAKTAAVAADVVLIEDSAASSAKKKVTRGDLYPFIDSPTGVTVVGSGAGGVNTSTTLAAFGYGAAYSHTSGLSNSAFGHESLWTNATGNYNSAFGAFSLFESTGSQNSAFGYSALQANVGASHNSAFGYNALVSSSSGTNNSAFGSESLATNQTGSDNAAFGYRALYTTNASNNSAFGRQALNLNSTGSSNSAFGYQALYTNAVGSNNAFGYQAAYSNSTGLYLSAFGHQALYTNTASDNGAFGFKALYTNGIGTHNYAFGNSALRLNSSGDNNSAFGHFALYSNTASNNSAFGYQALYSPGGNVYATTTGTRQTAIGMQTGQGSSTQRNDAVAVGYRALFDANDTVALGSGAQANHANGVALGKGIVTTAASQVEIGGVHIEMSEISDPGVGAANSARLYARDNGSGKTQLVVVFGSGAVQVLATQP